MTEKGDDSGNEGSKKFKSFTAYDVQKVRLEKLFNNIVSDSLILLSLFLKSYPF